MSRGPGKEGDTSLPEDTAGRQPVSGGMMVPFKTDSQGRISRRQFLRTSTLLGMSAGVATLASACGVNTEGQGETTGGLDIPESDENNLLTPDPERPVRRGNEQVEMEVNNDEQLLSTASEQLAEYGVQVDFLLTSEAIKLAGTDYRAAMVLGSRRVDREGRDAYQKPYAPFALVGSPENSQEVRLVRPYKVNYEEERHGQALASYDPGNNEAEALQVLDEAVVYGLSAPCETPEGNQECWQQTVIDGVLLSREEDEEVERILPIGTLNEDGEVTRRGESSWRVALGDQETVDALNDWGAQPWGTGIRRRPELQANFSEEERVSDVIDFEVYRNRSSLDEALGVEGVGQEITTLAVVQPEYQTPSKNNPNQGFNRVLAKVEQVDGQISLRQLDGEIIDEEGGTRIVWKDGEMPVLEQRIEENADGNDSGLEVSVYAKENPADPNSKNVAVPVVGGDATIVTPDVVEVAAEVEAEDQLHPQEQMLNELLEQLEQEGKEVMLVDRPFADIELSDIEKYYPAGIPLPTEEELEDLRHLANVYASETLFSIDSEATREQADNILLNNRRQMERDYVSFAVPLDVRAMEMYGIFPDVERPVKVETYAFKGRVLNAGITPTTSQSLPEDHPYYQQITENKNDPYTGLIISGVARMVGKSTLANWNVDYVDPENPSQTYYGDKPIHNYMPGGSSRIINQSVLFENGELSPSLNSPESPLAYVGRPMYFLSVDDQIRSDTDSSMNPRNVPSERLGLSEISDPDLNTDATTVNRIVWRNVFTYLKNRMINNADEGRLTDARFVHYSGNLLIHANPAVEGARQLNLP